GVTGVIAALVVGLIGTVLFAVREARQRGQAEHNAHIANEEKQAALYQAYRARVAAAGAALQNHDVADASRHLHTAPEALRAGECRHLHGGPEETLAVFPSPAGGPFFLPPGVGQAAGLPAPLAGGGPAPRGEGLRWAIFAGQSVRVLDEPGRTERTVS